jgi:hypothetical protein
MELALDLVVVGLLSITRGRSMILPFVGPVLALYCAYEK